MDALQKLWNLAKQQGQSQGTDWRYVFSPIGLILCDPPETESYDSTPANSIAFAKTGGDGVHYSFLEIDKPLHDSPVVMTVPMMFERPNLILGENLMEFLSLGCRCGYFSLEQLAYPDSRAEWIDMLSRSEVNPEVEAVDLLNLLNNKFDLHPWLEVASRLEELDRQFLSMIQNWRF